MKSATSIFQKSVRKYQRLRTLSKKKRSIVTKQRYNNGPGFPEKTAMSHEAALEIIQDMGLPHRNIKEGYHHPYPSERFYLGGKA